MVNVFPIYKRDKLKQKN